MTAKFVKKNFCVDESIISTASKEDAQELTENGRKLCKQGGFHFHMFVTNNMEIQNYLPTNE